MQADSGTGEASSRTRENEFFRAVEVMDASYDGRFVFGVPSRKTYCRPSCSIFPRGSEEILLFGDEESAGRAGYSRCRFCGGVDDPGRSWKMELVERICNLIRSDPSSPLSLADLEERSGRSRYTIQKVFMEIMGISPRKYVEECRISLLKRNLREGQPVPGAVYGTGYNSQSWLYKNAAAKLGMSPSSYRKGGEGAEIAYLVEECTLGFIMVARTEHGICALSMGDSENVLLEALKREFPKARISRSESVRKEMKSVMDYFDGQLLSLPLDIGGTGFQRRVWSALLQIPYGETRSYNEVARMIGNPRAYRAVANACAANPVPLIVPCHRVVRSDGGLGGYALGMDRKKYLLEMERKHAQEMQGA